MASAPGDGLCPRVGRPGYGSDVSYGRKSVEPSRIHVTWGSGGTTLFPSKLQYRARRQPVAEHLAPILAPVPLCPREISISAGGLITGTPTTAGSYPSITFRATQFCAIGGPDNPTSQLYTMTVSALSVSGSVSPSFLQRTEHCHHDPGLTYTFTTTPASSTTMTSTQGTFQVGGTTISTNSSQISANVVSGRGSVSEAITVLPSVIQSALSMGSSRMTYNRTFTNGTNTVTTQVTISITSEGGANLLITRMQLYFQNRMPVITIKRSDPT